MTKVRIAQGDLEGKLQETATGVCYVSFKGISYATAPTGQNRFMAPLPPKKWEGVLQAFDHGPGCPQRELFATAETITFIDGNEACLYLNVYTPKLDAKLPVMFWIHGGGFQSGSGDSFMYGPDYLIEEGVVVVTINYRLDIFGFLCLDTEDVPGNAGMKDQVFALRWVKENIAKFGGDPNNVTIFGESAGGASVAYHLLSPMSRGLFHKAIASSGSCFNHWAQMHDGTEWAFRSGKYASKVTKDKTELLTALRKPSPIELLKVIYVKPNGEDRFKGTEAFIFCPTVEKRFDGRECFLPEDPRDAIRNGNFNNVPLTIGFTDAEGTVYLRDIIKYAMVSPQKYLENRIPRDVGVKLSRDTIEKLALKLRKYYFGNKAIGEESQQEMVDLESDRFFMYGIQKFAREMASRSESPVFLYRFTAITSLNFAKNATGGALLKGASHADDIFYVFKTWMEVVPGSKEWHTIKRVVRMWTNFAKCGNPTPVGDALAAVQWKPIGAEACHYLDIGLELKAGINPDTERYEFMVGLDREASASSYKSHL